MRSDSTRLRKPFVRRPRRAFRPLVEALEQRLQPATINWTNRLFNDDFDLFGADEVVARAIVDRAIDDWERVIVDFNYGDGGNSLDVEITAAAGSNKAYNMTPDDDGKPVSASIQMNINGPGNGSPWYFDPAVGSGAVPDDFEFDEWVSPLVGYNGSINYDFYTAALHELGHALGITTDSDLALSDHLTLNVADDPNNPTVGDDLGDYLHTFNVGGGPVEATFTTAGGGHLYEGPAVNGYPIHPNDLVNDGRAFNSHHRRLISDFDASLLALAYGYTVQLPSQINTFYARLDTTSGELHVVGDADDADDVILIDQVGPNLRVRVNGTQELVPAAEVSLIVVRARDGDDFINLTGTPSGFTTSLQGEEGHDTILGSDGHDVLYGGPDADLLRGGYGNDTLDGAGGNDHMEGGPGNDFLNGGTEHDFLIGGTDQLAGGGDNDDIVVPPPPDGNDSINAGDGHDYIIADNASGDVPLTTGGGHDTVYSYFGKDTIFGGPGNDFLNGGVDADKIYGGDGNDTLIGEGGPDTLRGEDDNDALTGGAWLNGTLDDSADDLEGGNGDDVLFGDNFVFGPGGVGGPDTLRGGAGKDALYGQYAADLLVGDQGSDSLFGGDADDVLIGGIQTASPFGQFDTSADSLDGGAGNDTLLGDSGDVNPLNTGSIFGGADTLLGGTGDDRLYGMVGNDSLRGGSDDDTLDGGMSNDTLGGDGGEDSLLGGNGTDSLDGGNEDDTLLGGTQDDTLTGGPGADRLHGEDGDDSLDGGAGDDLVRGGDGDDTLLGGADNDLLLGEGGNDGLAGGDGRDILIGGRNQDRMAGEGGDDLLIGGSTNFDNNLLALFAIRAEWASPHSYFGRVNNLKGVANPEFAARLNGNIFLTKGVTVFDDDAVDFLTGGSDRDWFLFDNLAPVLDVVTDAAPGEVLN